MVLPVVLAGPIVRRVDADEAAIWIALRDAAKVEVAGWFGSGQTSTGPKTIAGGASPQLVGEAQTKAFGAHLHVAVVRAELDPSPPPGTIISYDVVIAGDQGLLALGLLEDEDANDAGPRPPRLALGYAKDVLPSFMTPPATAADVRLVHASCRQPKRHGPDAMPWIDDLLAQHLDDPQRRPQQLFLTGDQIYADDVAASHLVMLCEIGRELMGDEEMPFDDGVSFPVNESTVPALRRKRPTRVVGRFSSGAGSSHALTRGEFAAMYLAAWSPSVWRELADVDRVVDLAKGVTVEDERRLTKLDSTWPKPHRRKGLARDRLNIERYRDTVPRAARALANVATYMVADDHEVTDDWNLNAAWTARVRNADLGRAIVRHGLGAFTIFQAWGNDPPFVESGAGVKDAELLDLLETDARELSDADAQTAALDKAFGLTPDIAGVNPAPQALFNFRVEGLAHVVVGLDTRTRRTPSRGRESPPNLLGKSIDQQIPEGPLSDDRLLVVVSAVPLLMPRAIDAFAQPVAASVFDVIKHHAENEGFGDPDRPPRGFEKFDIEGWGAAEEHFEAALRRLATHPTVIVLSGDIHFSVDMMLDYFRRGDEPTTSRIVQFTSSAAKNPPGAKEQTIIRSHRWARAGIRGTPFERLAWTGSSTIQLAAGATIPPGRRARMRRSPALLPAAGWPTGTTIPEDGRPDWSWRLQVLRDERSDIDVGPNEPPTLQPYDASEPLRSHARIASAHASVAANQNEPLRSIVFPPNFGLVRFEREGDSLVAVHEVSSPNRAPKETGSPFTHHRVGMTPPAASDEPVLGIPESP